MSPGLGGGLIVADDRDRFEKVLAIAVSPGAYEGEAIAALRKARELVGKNPALAHPPPPRPPSPKPSPPADHSFTTRVTNVAPFWLNILLTDFSEMAYKLRLISKITCDFTQTPIAVDIRCDGPKDACSAFQAHVNWLINYINARPLRQQAQSKDRKVLEQGLCVCLGSSQDNVEFGRQTARCRAARRRRSAFSMEARYG